MRIFVLGTRGIPGIPGGVETHCQNLYPRIARRGHQVTVARRTGYVTGEKRRWEGVDLIDIYSPRLKSLEALVHTFFGILRARLRNEQLIHIHGIGPALLTPIARVMGLKVVMTNHGPDYDRSKWGRVAKAVLRCGEYLGCKFANEVVTISEPIHDIVKKRVRRESTLIPNGVEVKERSTDTDMLDYWSLKSGQYIMAVARFVPEKGLHDLLSAYEQAQVGWKLVLVGDADHESSYSSELKRRATATPNTVLTGYLVGDELHQIFSHAGLFVLPSYHEGLPITLLEAISYEVPVLASDILPNRQIELPETTYFHPGDTVGLRRKLEASVTQPSDRDSLRSLRDSIRRRFDWDRVCEETLRVYEKCLW